MTPIRFHIRQAVPADVRGIARVQLAAWGADTAASEETYNARINRFPEGIFVAEHEETGAIIGVVAAHPIRYDVAQFVPREGENILTWWEASGHGVMDNIDLASDTLYGVDLAGDPAYTGSGAAAQLLVREMQNVIDLGKKRLVLGCRLPAYHKHQDVPLAEYIRTRVVRGARSTDASGNDITPERREGWKYLDPELDWFCRRFCRGRTYSVIRELRDYFPEDIDSCGHAALICYDNPVDS